MATIKLNTTLIIVIAASGLLGCTIILLLILRCCRRPKPTPLPPIQPLAHHRQKESTYFTHPHTLRKSLGPNQFGIYESDTSFLKPSGKPSFQTDGSDGTPSSSNFSFLNHSSPQLTLTSSPRQVQDEQSATQQYVPTNRQTRSVSRGPRRPRSRVISVASTSTVFTQPSPRPTSIIRGAPHSALSNVQIVLPAPLASQLQNHMTALPSVASRRSIYDQSPSTQDTSRGRTTSTSSKRRRQRPLDTRDRSRPSGSQTELRGPTPSDRSIRSHPPSHYDPTPSPPSSEDQTHAPVIPQGPSDGQDDFATGLPLEVRVDAHISMAG